MAGNAGLGVLSGAAAEVNIAHTGWTPLPLKPIFWIPYLFLLVGLAVALEVLLSVSKKRNGWSVAGDITDPKDWLHYVVILPPAFVAAGIVAIWASTDLEIKKMQVMLSMLANFYVH